MKTAILFTGQLRTIQRTSKVLKKNLIDPNNSDVFIFCEERLADQQYGTQESGSLEHLKNAWGSSIKSLVVADEDPAYWRGTSDSPPIREEYRTSRGSVEGLSPGGKLWYESTGAALEYYQLRKAYEEMCAEEERTGEKYDVVCRCRFDVALLKEIKFSNYYSPEVFWSSIEAARKQARKLGLGSRDILYAALLSGGNMDRMQQVLHGEMAEIGYSGVVDAENLGDCIRASKGDVLYQRYLEVVKSIDIKEKLSDNVIADFLSQVPGVFAIRCNVLYFTARSRFDNIVSLSNCVGEYSSDTDLDWCSENQFSMHLVSNGLISFNYQSRSDENYLLGIELGAIALDPEGDPEVFLPDGLTWTIVRKNKQQMEEDWLNLDGFDNKQSGVEILT